MTQNEIGTLIACTSIGQILRVTSKYEGKGMIYEGRIQSKRTFVDGRWRVEFDGGAYITPGLGEGNPRESVYTWMGTPIEDIETL